jgi:hypothetical protein
MVNESHIPAVKPKVINTQVPDKQRQPNANLYHLPSAVVFGQNG